MIAAGKTGRDYNTLVEAFSELKCNLKIFCSSNSAPKEMSSFRNIYVTANPLNDNSVSYTTLMMESERALAIAIPLESGDYLAGLTSFLDALALGKPILMTENRYIDINIEEEGFGIWIKRGDVDSWKRAVNYLLSNPTEIVRMGNNANSACASQYNIEFFAKQLAHIILNLGRS